MGYKKAGSLCQIQKRPARFHCQPWLPFVQFVQIARRVAAGRCKGSTCEAVFCSVRSGQCSGCRRPVESRFSGRMLRFPALQFLRFCYCQRLRRSLRPLFALHLCLDGKLGALAKRGEWGGIMAMLLCCIRRVDLVAEPMCIFVRCS